MKNTGIVYSSTEKTPIVLPEMETLLPPLSEEQRSLLETDMLTNGCYAPIIVNEGLVVIDGHNRLSVCREHEIPFQMLVFSFEDMLEAKQWALDTQKGRRNLTTWELAKIGLKLLPDVEAKAQANMSAGGQAYSPKEGRTPVYNPPEPVDTSQELADMVGIGRTTMNRAIQIHEHAPDIVKEALDQNDLSVKQGYDITKQVQALPEEDREQAAADLIQAQYNKAVEKLDSELAQKEKISKQFCRAFEKAALLEATEDNVRAWVECTRMPPAEMADTVKDSLNLSQVFRDIAKILQTKILPEDWRGAHEDS